MKMLIVLACILFLTGCVVADMDSSNYTSVPWVQVFQKINPETGLTDVQQRKADLYDCGVDRRDNLDSPHWSLNSSYPDETIEHTVEKNRKVINCMKGKGYKVYSFAQCGPLKKPTGLCPN